ncbi:hypothetical protein LCDVSa175L [Lymphocystis disease virus 3]|uniref:Uncharacterized protein n=1 Tax=Lymphocystis disease virus 3 TaxID=2560566 RepID=A0A1B2RW86_9VIRU|nr:hypothetical protein BZK12_gp175 [Lymphocystis disease virus Sa]AOC55259.1 hypothetical protein LCDVSa175L [Lymphocystis disease virus 3]
MNQWIEFDRLKKLKFSISMQNFFKLTVDPINTDPSLNSDIILNLRYVESIVNEDNFDEYLSLFKTAFKDVKADHITYLKLKNMFENMYDLLRCKIHGKELRKLMEEYNLLLVLNTRENYCLTLVNVFIIFLLATDKYL